MYVVLGATGHTGSVIATSLLLKGEKVRVVGRDATRLQRFVRKGAEAFTANVNDAAALGKAFAGARAAYLMLPPSMTSQDYRANQERESDAIAKAVKESGLRYAVHLSSYGAHVAAGTGPIAGLYSSEQKLNAIGGLNVLHLRPPHFLGHHPPPLGTHPRLGITARDAALFIEMYKRINAGLVAAQGPRSPENPTPTSFEKFVQDVFVPAYHGKAATA